MKKAVAVVDDDPDSLALLAILLKERYCASTYADGHEAVKAFQSMPPDLILMDIGLDGADGTDILHKVKTHQRLKNIPVIALTGHALKGDRDKYRQLGFDDYFSKPIVDPRMLFNLMDRLLAKPVHPKKSTECIRDGNQSNFIATMTHEMRAPLNSVIGFSNVLLKNSEGHLNEEELSYAKRIRDNSKYLLNLIEMVSDLSKIDMGKEELKLTPICLKALIEETLLLLEGKAIENSILLCSEVPNQLRLCKTDPDKLRRILINLISNAIQFSQEGGMVKVRVEMDSQSCLVRRIDIIDDGIGISEDKIPLLFQPFYQIDRNYSRHYRGSGLGLYITASLCKLLNYHIVVTSEVGKGSTFSVITQC